MARSTTPEAHVLKIVAATFVVRRSTAQAGVVVEIGPRLKDPRAQSD
jgi:hypothetical protein